MVDAGGEVDLGWLEWVVGWEVNCEEEDTSRVWRVSLILKSVLYSESQWRLSKPAAQVLDSGLDGIHRDRVLLTGPMMVACQWNYKTSY